MAVLVITGRIPEKCIYDNAAICLNVIEQARKANVKKFCSGRHGLCYPKTPPQYSVYRGRSLEGYPEKTNGPYGLAKKMALVQLQAYRQEYGFNGIYLLPTNLYGRATIWPPVFARHSGIN